MGIEDILKGLKTNDPEEHLRELPDNCDFNTYQIEFMPEKSDPEKFVVTKVKETRSGYDIDMGNMVIPGISSPCFVPKECGIDMKEGMLVIFDGSRYVDANRSITFYSPQGELLGGYKDVNGVREIIKPNKKSGKEFNATLKERIANKEINNEGELAPVWVDPNDHSKGRVPVSPLNTRILLDKIRKIKEGKKAIKEDVAKPINNEGKLADNCDFETSKNEFIPKYAPGVYGSKTSKEILAGHKRLAVERTVGDIAQAYEAIDKMPPALRLLGRAMMDEGLPDYMVVFKLKAVRDIVLSQGAERDYYTKEKKALFALDMPAVECLEQLQKDGVLNEKLNILKPEKFLESEIVTTAAGLHVANIDLRNTPTMENYKMFTNFRVHDLLNNKRWKKY